MEDKTSNSSPRSRKMLWLNISCGIAVAVLTFFVICWTPLHHLMPGYLTPQSREQVINFALRMDSLEQAVKQQNMYVTNLQDILNGQVRLDSVTSIDSLTVMRAEELMERTEREKEFARQYEEAEKYNLTTLASRVGGVSGLNLQNPVRGSIQKEYDPNNYHYGVDVAADADGPVLATLDGTVLFAAFTAGERYVVALQHTGDLVSIYMHCGRLLVNEGDKVRTGDAIATVADVEGLLGERPSSDIRPYLHFELWHKGVSLDPTLYITF